MKIALACSVGGHFTQMRQLEKMYKRFDHFFITEDTLMTREYAEKERIYFLRLINRKKWNFLYLFLVNLLLSVQVLLKEKPDVIICTGALSSIPFCVIGKMLGIKLIFIESFAKMDTPTMTGKLMYKFADLFIVQWEKMLEHYPKAVYGGSIY
ncbi:UDP-N-acetylglucosamine:LPS N-acetylglucosamine transferase [Paenibacillus mucilaginosus]|uniref:PssD/Cps14F family polysaccharide biosynthesis glycosyltransferase n=1 Tax=Paenibacillus mucilaginosus TaxID=61624 RepID=UPI003D2341FC